MHARLQFGSSKLPRRLPRLAGKRPCGAVRATLISKTPISPLIPRSDMMEQLGRWAEIEVKAEGLDTYGVFCEVEHVKKDDVPWGFQLHLQKEGKTSCTLKMSLDDEVTTKHEFIGRSDSGMPQPMGEVTEIAGAHFEIWKVDDASVDEELRAQIKALCNGVAEALKRYYAFGSVFSEDL